MCIVVYQVCFSFGVVDGGVFHIHTWLLLVIYSGVYCYCCRRCARETFCDEGGSVRHEKSNAVCRRYSSTQIIGAREHGIFFFFSFFSFFFFFFLRFPLHFVVLRVPLPFFLFSFVLSFRLVVFRLFLVSPSSLFFLLPCFPWWRILLFCYFVSAIHPPRTPCEPEVCVFPLCDVFVYAFLMLVFIFLLFLPFYRVFEFYLDIFHFILSSLGVRCCLLGFVWSRAKKLRSNHSIGRSHSSRFSFK